MIPFLVSYLNTLCKKKGILTQHDEVDLEAWFDLHILEMKLSGKQKIRYKSVVFHWFLKLWILHQDDANNSVETFLQELNELVDRQDHVVKRILTKTQYTIHHKNLSDFIEVISKRVTH